MTDKPAKSKWNPFKAARQGQKAEKDAPQKPSPEETPAKAPPVPAQPAAPPVEEFQLPQPKSRATDDQARLSALYAVSRVLGTSLNLDEVLTQVIDAVVGLTGAERGLLVFTEAGPEEWTLRVARNFDEDKLSTWDKEISRTIINTAIETRKGVVTADAQSDSRFAMQASVIFNVLRSTMCTPLLARGRVIGAIYVDSRIQKGIFDDEDLEMLDTFATQAAFAIDNARIYTRTIQKVQQLTIELDETRKARQVAEITETEYFKKLRDRAQAMRESTKDKPSEP